MNTVQDNPKTVSAQEMWGAAVCATRINKTYSKEGEWDYDDNKNQHVQKKFSNKELMRDILEKGKLTDKDIKAGAECQDYIRGKLTLKALMSGHLSTFEQSLRGIIDREEFLANDRKSIGLIAYQPTAMHRYQAEEELNKHIRNGKPVGDVDDRADLTITVLKSVYSRNYEKWYITGATEQDQVVFFPFNNSIKIGTTVDIKGTVKGFRDNQTKLNRVKVQK